MARASHILPLALLGASLLPACTYDEGLEIRDMRGSVVLPEEAATRIVDGEEVTDVRNIGPVYIGAYPSVQEGFAEYPYPEVGPVFQTGVAGDTYPYGGTTVGDYRHPCLEALQCRVVSGRYVDFDHIVTWFNDNTDVQLTDDQGNPMTGEYLRQVCFDLFEYTSDDEVRLTATEDRNDDGTINAKDLDFVQRSDGKWEAEFTLWQQEYFEDAETGQGFSLWGWMDAPSESFRFNTCDPEEGNRTTEYDEQFYGGAQYRELLNHPDERISTGDWVPSTLDDVWVYSSPDDENVEIHLNHRVEN